MEKRFVNNLLTKRFSIIVTPVTQEIMWRF